MCHDRVLKAYFWWFSTRASFRKAGLLLMKGFKGTKGLFFSIFFLLTRTFTTALNSGELKKRKRDVIYWFVFFFLSILLSLFFLFKLNIRTTLKGTDPVLKQHSFKHLASSLYTAAKRHADYPEGSWVRPPQCPVIARERQSYLGLPELWDFGKRHFWYQEEVCFFL